MFLIPGSIDTTRGGKESLAFECPICLDVFKDPQEVTPFVTNAVILWKKNTIEWCVRVLLSNLVFDDEPRSKCRRHRSFN
jgi:hypothetical protein